MKIARAISNWLVDDWLAENNYPLSNVAVFDLYNVLTHPDNHHRFHDGQIEHLTTAGSDTLYYDSGGDDHPNAHGGRKASEEFVPLLNIYVNRWKADLPYSAPTEEQGQADPPESQPPQVVVMADAVIDNFEIGPIPGTDYWVPYRDEAVPTSVQCSPTADTSHQGTKSLQIDFNVLPGSWASCELLFSTQQLEPCVAQFYLLASQAGLPYGLLFYYQLADEDATSVIELETSPESVVGWQLITVPWEQFAEQDSLVYPETGLGIAFVFGEGADSGENAGTLWFDDLAIYSSVGEEAVEENQNPPSSANQQPENQAGQNNQQDQGGLPFCW